MKVFLLEAEPIDPVRRYARMRHATRLLAAKIKNSNPNVHELDINARGPRNINLDFIAIHRKARKQGVGSEVIKKISKFADRHRSTIELALAQKGNDFGTTSPNRLRKFYGRHGFVNNRGTRKDSSLSTYTAMYRRPKTESADVSGFKVDRVTTVASRTMPHRKITKYEFKHGGGRGAITIHHGKGTESTVDFDVKRSDRRPDVRNTLRILKTVEKAIRHHALVAQPKKIGYYALSDNHDRRGHNRRDAIYRKLGARMSAGRWTAKPSSVPGRVTFIKGRK